ncbi:hypothetical protein FQN57_002126 [Myotisia sp. PD_48]|nr:hypothetical protein FQN57_002126 [Myotisia sp. PD_48]
MALHFLFSLLLAILGLRATVAAAEHENDFEDHPTTKRVPMRSFGLQAPYLDTDISNRWFDFGGDTVIRADRYIRLTADRQSQSGWLFSRVPLTATNWQIEVEFSIHGEGSLHGDGMAMWLTKERAKPGPVFGSVDRFEGLGIFIDTYKNGRQGITFPMVMAMLGDGNTKYDSAKDGKANDIASCSARGIRGASVPTKLRLTYFQDKYLALDLQYKSDHSWTSCFKITPTEDTPIKIPSIAYLGFTAETGELTDNHDILSVDAYSLYSKQNTNSASPPQTTPEKGTARNVPAGEKHHSGGGWLSSIFKFFLFIAVLGGVYVGWTIYRSSKRGARF